MANQQFGVRLGELTEVQRDWHSVSDRMAEMGRELRTIQSALTRAAATRLSADPRVDAAGLTVALALVREVREMESQVTGLLATKTRLVGEIADDAQKIKAVEAGYRSADDEAAGRLRRIGNGPATASWSGGGSGTVIDGAGAGGGAGGGAVTAAGWSGGGGGGGVGSGGGSGSTGGGGGFGVGGILTDRGAGDWATRTDARGWDGWSPGGRRHPRNGEGGGVVDEPRLDGASAQRRGIVARALERARRRLGYSQSSVTNGYRVDCSGLVSDAWGLPGPGLDTYGLMSPDVSHRIDKEDLQPGDAMISGDHTLVFGGWADAAHTSYIGIEDSGSRGCVSHVIPYPYYSGSGPYYPYRRNGVG